MPFHHLSGNIIIRKPGVLSIRWKMLIWFPEIFCDEWNKIFRNLRKREQSCKVCRNFGTCLTGNFRSILILKFFRISTNAPGEIPCHLPQFRNFWLNGKRFNFGLSRLLRWVLRYILVTCRPSVFIDQAESCSHPKLVTKTRQRMNGALF